MITIGWEVGRKSFAVDVQIVEVISALERRDESDKTKSFCLINTKRVHTGATGHFFGKLPNFIVSV